MKSPLSSPAGCSPCLLTAQTAYLGNMPGEIARTRNHPQADAIKALGWIGLIMGGVGWAVALVWAYMNPVSLRPVVETVAPAATGTADSRTEESS